MEEPIRQTLVGLRLSQKLKLDAIATERGLSRSELLRKIVDQFLEGPYGSMAKPREEEE